MNGDLSRNLPVSIEAEQAVLGSIIRSPECFTQVSGLLTAADFKLDEHQRLFAAMNEMFLQSKNMDPVTLIDALVQSGQYDNKTGIEYIQMIAKGVPSVSNVVDYAKIVKGKSTLRRLIEACEKSLEEAYAEEGEVSAIVDSAEQRIFEVAQDRERKEFKRIRDVMNTVYAGLEFTSEHPGMIDGAKTGFSGLDRVLVQLGKGDLVLIGARPGMGKTSFAMNVAVNIAKETKKTVCVFSLEMSAEQLAVRMLSSEALVNSYSLRSGQIQTDEWKRLAYAVSELSNTEILIDDTSGISPTEMKSKLRRVDNLGLVVVDYLQLMQSGRNIDNRVQEVGDISRNLKIMAKDLGVPVICCAQLSRGPESRTSKKPMLSDLRDSGAIEQDADMVLFLYREEYYKDSEGAKDPRPNVAEVIVAKNRHGSVGSVEMGWNGEFTKFLTLDESKEGEQ
ncbi:MAG: replicative DNA helicase [Clostridia bacterium]|nr:replicative DNA helicase [Clostridia bacterium]